MLRACKRILRPGGRLAYLTIVIAEGLTKDAAREAKRLGPRAVAARAPDDVLMRRAGFHDIEVTDVSSSFMQVAHAWLAQYRARATEIEEILGVTEAAERQSGRAGMIRGIEEGLLRRVFVEGAAP